jgi:hypothetical protein
MSGGHLDEVDYQPLPPSSHVPDICVRIVGKFDFLREDRTVWFEVPQCCRAEKLPMPLYAEAEGIKTHKEVITINKTESKCSICA